MPEVRKGLTRVYTHFIPFSLDSDGGTPGVCDGVIEGGSDGDSDDRYLYQVFL